MGDLGRLKTNWTGNAPLRGNAAERTPESVAMLLRNARILQGYRLDEVANALNIRESHLEALEDNRFADLPPLVYAQGFVNAYAGFLGLDRGELVTRFREESDVAPAPLPQLPTFNLNSVPDAAERRKPQLPVILAGFGLILLCYLLWQAVMPDNREVVLEVPPLPTRFEEAPAPMAAAPVIAAEPVAVPVAAPVENYTGLGIITLRATAESWIQLRNTQGERLASLVLRAGEIYTAPTSQQGLSISTGSLQTVTLMLDNQPVALKGVAGRSRYDVQLDPIKLLNGTAVSE